MLLVDVVAAATVFVKRRDSRALPDFVRADTSQVDWDLDPYPSATAAGFSVDIAEPGRVRPTGLITYRENKVSPALNAMYVMAALDEAKSTGDAEWLDRAETAMSQALRTSNGGFLAHEFSDTDVFGRDLPHPWYSAQAQGLALSALARLYQVTGDPRWRSESQPIFAALTTFRGYLAGSKPAADPWLNVVDNAGYLWFEQFTRGAAPAMVLANEMHAALGIYDYQRVLAEGPGETRRARSLFAGGLATVTKYAARTRTPGRISKTSLAADQHDPRAHDIVEGKLGFFSRITGDASLARLARQLDKDDNLPIFRLVKVHIRERDLSPYSPLPAEAPFTIRPAAPVDVTPTGHVTYRGGEINAGASASYALAALDQYDKTSDERWLNRAKVAVRQVLASSREGGVLPYLFPNTEVNGTPLPIPWYSSEGQGLLLSALVRLSDTTGDTVWRKRSDPVFAALTRVRNFGPDGAPPPRAWLTFVDDDGFLWFEQYAGGIAPSAVVPGHLAALLGVYDYWRLTDNPVAKLLFEGGTTTMLHYLPQIRRKGRPSLYALGDRRPDTRFDETVTRQLKTLAGITGDARIARFAAL